MVDVCFHKIITFFGPAREPFRVLIRMAGKLRNLTKSQEISKNPPKGCARLYRGEGVVSRGLGEVGANTFWAFLNLLRASASFSIFPESTLFHTNPWVWG